MAVDYEGLKKILDQFPFGVLLAGEDGEVILCNDKAPALLETDPIDLMEKGLAAAPAWSGLSETVLSLGAAEQLRRLNEVSRGRKYFSVTVSRDGLSLFGKGCIIAMIADITRQKELEDLRSGFFSEFIRRIKGPLTSVKTALSVLSSERYCTLGDEPREVAQLGHEEVQRLHALLSDMENLFELDSQDAGTELYLENLEVRSILTRCMRRARKGARGLHREITAAWPETRVPLRVVADYEKLALVLHHLVDNALAYSPASSPVRLSAAEAAGVVEIRIEDGGPGVSPEVMRRIFERFFRYSDPGKAGSRTGGMGLILSKGYTELMGGALVLERIPGSGTAAIVRLPPVNEGGWVE